MEKGYKHVTMKDIVDACEISRGGLYLYFPGTRELFLEVFKAEQEDSGSEFEQKIGKDFGPADMLALFLKEQKRGLLTKKGTLQKACYEFVFEENKNNCPMEVPFVLLSEAGQTVPVVWEKKGPACTPNLPRV